MRGCSGPPFHLIFRGAQSGSTEWRLRASSVDLDPVCGGANGYAAGPWAPNEEGTCYGTFVGRTHPADRDGLRLQLSPESHSRPTWRAFRVKHIRVDVDLAALSLPHPVARHRYWYTRKQPQGEVPAIFSFRRHFAGTASMTSMAITGIRTLRPRPV
jgi:hypothetical protein